MSVVVIGLNHRTVPLDLLERMAISDARLPKALHDVASRDNVREAVVLSTCNRLEIYAHVERFHAAYQDIRDFLAEASFVAPEDFSDHLYVHYDAAAARHLFTVASGLDSAVVGEDQVLGQVREAWQLARAEGVCGPTLELLFRRAVEVGKRARSDTAISRGVASVSSAAVAMASERLGTLRGRRVLVLGAGEMAEGMVKALLSEGAADVSIANRTWENAKQLADSVDGRALRLADVAGEMREVDLILTGTGASSIMVEHGDLAAAMAARSGRELLVVDVAVPRDVEPAAASLDGVTLLDMDDLRSFARRGMEQRLGEVAAVEAIIDEDHRRFTDELTAREVSPLIASLHEHAESVRLAELERFRSRLADLEGAQSETVEALTRALVAKLVHRPTVTVRDAAGTPRGERLAESLRDLFDL